MFTIPHLNSWNDFHSEKKITLKYILLLSAFILPLFCFAQPKENSPYSRFGIGDVADRNFFNSQQMGGLGASFSSPYQINIVNPAALSQLEVTSFDVGLHAEYSGLRDSSSPEYQNLWSGNLSYLSLAIPLQNKLNDILDRKTRNFGATTAFSLLPYSNVGYNISVVDDSNPDIGSYLRNFSGEGGTYQFMWSNGVRYKNFSGGLNLSYLFGKINYFKNLQLLDIPSGYLSTFETSEKISGFLWNLGVMYTHYFNLEAFEEREASDLKKLTIGLYGNANTSINVTESSLSTGNQIIGGSIIRDTLGTQIDDVKSTGTLPSQLGFGLTYYNGEKYAIGIDYARTDWSNFRADFVNNPLKNTSKLSIGGFFRPNYKSVSSYFSRVHYRFGVHYKLVPNEEVVSGETITDVGFNFGMGLPFYYQRKVSHANLGFSAGLRGRGTAIEERYIKISFSFTFNDDEWLIKRKYN